MTKAMDAQAAAVTSTSPIAYCLFDMDGLLLDTERIYTHVTQSIVARYGKQYDWSVKAEMMGMPQRDAANFIIDKLDLPISPVDYLAERNARQEELFPEARPLPGVMRLVRHLKRHGVPMAVATSSHSRAFKIKAQNNRELFDLFDLVVTGDDAAVARGKPHPDIFEVAAQRLGCDITQQSRRCLVFEDAPAGVRAARAANMNVCWVPDPNLARGDIEADLVLSTLEEFEPGAWGLPPFADDGDDEGRVGRVDVEDNVGTVV